MKEYYSKAVSCFLESKGVFHTEAYNKILEKREQHIKAYERAIKEMLTVEIKFIRFNYIGLPRSGKTSFLRRILGEILNILEARGKGEMEQPSTGVAEERARVLIRQAHTEMGAISPSNSWSPLKSLEEEASMILQWIHEAAHNPESSCSTNTSVDKSVASSGKSDTTVPLVEDAHSHSTHSTVNQSGNPDSRDEGGAHAMKTEDRDRFKCELDGGTDILSVFKKVMESEVWDQVKHKLDGTILLSNTDTGGHIEFLDLHAALVHGPSFNLLFRRLTDKLDREFKIHYTNKEGVSTEEEESTLTVEEIMLQSLSSIAGFCGSFSNSAAEEEPDPNALYKSARSKAMIVGTFLDKVTEEVFIEEDELLQKKIKNTDFFKEDIVEFVSETQLMLAVDNMKGSQQEIDKIRTVLSRVIERCFEKIAIPLSWLVFSLYIRSLKRRAMRLEECEKIAGIVGISPSELQHALWFLHHVGVLLYYPELEALKGTVICDTQVVYDSATNLIKNTFTFDNVGKCLSEKFREKAQFSLADVKKATSNHTDDLIPLETLVELLKYLNILTTIPSPGGDTQDPTYFMPCVLKSARASEMIVPCSESDPAPLMIRYNCGYTPAGLFPSMIASLVSPQLEGWEMIEEGLCKNRVQFHVGGDCDTVTLLLYPHFIEIAISRDQESKFEVPIERVCANLRTVIKSTLEHVTSRMNSKFQMRYKFGFECPAHPGKEHLCVLDNEMARKMKCLQNPKKKDIIGMGPRHAVWFSSSRSGNKGSDVSAYVSSLPPCARPLLEQQLDWDNKGVDKDLVEIAHHMLDWEEKLCTHLGLTEEDIHDINAKHSKPPNPELQRREALNMWKSNQGLNATYGNLLEIFVKAGHSRCAEAVCEVLKKKKKSGKPKDIA